MYLCNTSGIHGLLPFVGLFVLFISLSCYSYLNSCSNRIIQDGFEKYFFSFTEHKGLG